MRNCFLKLCLILCLALGYVRAEGCSADVAGLSPVGAWLKLPAQRISPFPLPPNLRVSVVVPVYRELTNQHLYRLLFAFARQTAHRDRFRLVFVVNNTPETAAKKDKIWRENRETVEYLTALAKNEMPLVGDIAPANRVLDKGISIDVVDRTDPGIPRNIGNIRRVGIERAMYLHEGSLRQLIINQFDADSIPPDRYIDDTLEAFSDPQLNSALFSLFFKIPLDAPAEQHATFYRYRADFHLQELNLALFRPNPWGTPRICTRASYLQEIGGMADLDSGEDSELIRRSGGPLGLHRVLYRNPVTTADRMRSYGYDAQWRQTTLDLTLTNTERKQEVTSKNFDNMKDIVELLRQRLPPQERDLLEREIIYWREVHQGEATAVRENLTRLRSGFAVEKQWPEDEAAWENTGNASFWVTHPQKALSLNWNDFEASGSPGALSVPMESNALILALSRFFEVAREYPDRFPATIRYLKARRLIHLFDHYTVYLNNEKHIREYQAAMETLLSQADFSENLRLVAIESILPMVGRRSEMSAVAKLLLAELPARQRERNAPLEDRINYAQHAAYMMENILLNFDREKSTSEVWREWAETVAESPEALGILVLAYPKVAENVDPTVFEILGTLPGPIQARLRDQLLMISRRDLSSYKQKVLETARDQLVP